ncbi:MAG TPA: S41 family peptidase, partial [Telluria sp.]|nr:S41 family peptidase [Telluria sp.]
MNKKWLGAGLLACAVAASAIAMKEPGMAIDAGARKAAIAALSAQLRAHHVAREIGEEAAAHIAQRERAGIYAGIADRKALAAALNRDLPPQAGVFVEYAAPPRWPGAGTVRTETYRAEIGYLAVSRFDAAAQAAPQYARALHELRHARSIIIDLRDNPGGDAEAMRILASYFVDRPLRLSDVHRPGQPTVQVWTERALPTKPHLGQVYILVNHGTGAEAEEFAYAMQRLKRGPVVGETTAGVAWRSATARLDEHLAARIPAASATAPDSAA